jgi:hypothetical protein
MLVSVNQMFIFQLNFVRNWKGVLVHTRYLGGGVFNCRYKCGPDDHEQKEVYAIQSSSELVQFT